jgi:putative transposase
VYYRAFLNAWEMLADRLPYIKEKAKSSNMLCFTGSERGTSSTCPSCDAKKKVRGRVWKCGQCKFIGHRDVVGTVNMHLLAFGEKVMFPHSITYLRPGEIRGRSSSPGTGQSCLGMIGNSNHRDCGRLTSQATSSIAA